MADINIREIRESLGESQAEFGKRFGVDQTTIHKWEKRGLPGRGAARTAVEQFIKAREAEPHQNGAAA